MLSFSTKANTLKSLENLVTKCKILSQVNFTVDELENNPNAIHNRVISEFADKKIIVRSSALSEDSEESSHAGQFLSVLNISSEDVLVAAQKVAASYSEKSPLNQILVQPMLTDITMSGVLFTVDPNTGGNYFVINYDDISGSSESVTSGSFGDLSTCYIFHGKKSGNQQLDALVDSAYELMEIFNTNAIDVEFAFDAEGIPILLQARPLVLKCAIADFEMQKTMLARAHDFIIDSMSTHPYAKGQRSIYSVMSDWNPAEMIGLRPKPLASSLYRRLITDGTWAYQRDEYGYRNLRSFPLLLEFCGLTYIDTRVSFNSFIPKSIDDELSEKLANYYLDCLAKEPNKHDKVEFDIVYSCNTFDLSERIKTLLNFGFSTEEIKTLKNALQSLTNNVISTTNGLWITDTKKIDILDKRREIIINSEMNDISKIYWLMADCTRYGTLPFAGLARAGFISVLLLKSLVSIGILSENDYNNYMCSLSTISSEMTTDWQDLSKSAFLRKYGHLRPGTYDISSKRYDAAPEMYLGEQSNEANIDNRESFTLSLKQYAAIQQAMKKHGFDGDVLALFEYIKAGIEGREYSKFIFTKSLSYVLELFVKLGSNYGFTREDMSYLDYMVFERLYSSAENVERVLAESIRAGKERYAETLTFTMPPVILDPTDIYSFHLPSGAPNFITLGDVCGDVCSDNLNRDTAQGKILLIRAADPGFDWIFSCNIIAFVTAYGGANSHMAIRAGELGIPAVIGVGEKEFNRLSQAKTLRLDCSNKKIEVIR